MSPQETPRLPGCPQSPKRSATAERNAAARPTRKSQAQTCCHLNECCISEEVAAVICESPLEMGNDGLAAPGHDPAPSTRSTTLPRRGFVWYAPIASASGNSAPTTGRTGPASIRRAISSNSARRGWTMTTNADDRLALDSLGRVERGDGVVEGRDVADVRPQPTIPYPLDEITQLGAIGYDDEVDSQAARGPRLGRAGNGHQRSSGANHARRPLRD